MSFWKSITKKAVKEATEAVKEEVSEKVEENAEKYLPMIVGAVALCVGVGILMRSPKQAADTAPKVMVMLVDSRGIHRL